MFYNVTPCFSSISEIGSHFFLLLLASIVLSVVSVSRNCNVVVVIVANEASIIGIMLLVSHLYS